MGWDYWTYRNQPAIFVDEIWKHMVVEAEVKKEDTPLPSVSRPPRSSHK